MCGAFTGVPADASGSGPAVPPRPARADTVGGVGAELLRHPGRLVAASVVTVAGLVVAGTAGSAGQRSTADAPAAEHATPDAVLHPVPGDGVTWLPAARRAAATCPGLPSSVLVAIGHVESSLGLQAGMSSAGAVGPMQFLPSTWALYAADGDGDGRADVMNATDAVHGAARLLCANGAGDPERLASALWHYNPSEDYVRHVMAVARFMPTDS